MNNKQYQWFAILVCWANVFFVFTGFSQDSLYDNDYLSKEFHNSRRQALRNAMPENSVAAFFSNSDKNRSNDVNFEFHQDPNFYYLTGFNEPNALLLIFKDYQTKDSIRYNEFIFVPAKDSTAELWNGKRFGINGVKEKLGFENCHAGNKFADFRIDFPSFYKVYFLPGFAEIMDDNKDRGDLYSLKKHFKLKLDSAMRNVDLFMLKEMMAALREVKTPEEIVLLRKAIDITCKAQNELMKTLTPGITEYQAEALVEYNFKYEGAESPGFPSTIGGGENSCILHYTSNRKKLLDNDLLVVDVGAEYHGYSADVTRTYPVNGKYSEEQKIIYNIVLEAQLAGIEACKPGNKFWAPNQEAVKVVTKRLLQLGLIESRENYRQYFMHGTSHYLGLDVHDIGLYGVFVPGNVLTVEPGIYIPAGSNCDQKWWNIGVRIEDDVLITDTGKEVLSDCIPKSVEEIEKFMNIDGKL